MYNYRYHIILRHDGALTNIESKVETRGWIREALYPDKRQLSS